MHPRIVWFRSDQIRILDPSAHLTVTLTFFTSQTVQSTLERTLRDRS